MNAVLTSVRWGLGLALVAAGIWPVGRCSAADANGECPNVVLIYCDDLGYSDVGCFGAQGFQTPNLDRLAHEGRRFTSYYAAQPVCTSSRAALLTGCYPNRLGLVGALGPSDRHGIHADETTLAEVLHGRGYATAIFGKWHLGHHPQFLPTRHGFDEYFGLPYSNDMWPEHPSAKFPDLPLIEGEKTVAVNPDQSQLTTWYTEHAVDFIARRHDHPFFVYLAHSMPHVPLFVSDKFKGKSEQGLFGDVLMEIDWSVGQVMAALDEQQLADKTLVIFTSDNGPWLAYGDHGGSARPLREGKMTTFDGGVREPCILRWTGHIPAGSTCDEPVMNIDLLPTVARLAGAQLPADRPIDGLDIWPLIAGTPGAQSPHEVLYFYWLGELQSLRAGRWKLHFPHDYSHVVEPGRGGKPGRAEKRRTELALFDLASDIGETVNVAAEHPDVVSRLQQLADKAREDLGDTAQGRTGKNIRKAGRVGE
jgi:arylsulfatase A-like enzyme